MTKHLNTVEVLSRAATFLRLYPSEFADAGRRLSERWSEIAARDRVHEWEQFRRVNGPQRIWLAGGWRDVLPSSDEDLARETSADARYRSALLWARSCDPFVMNAESAREIIVLGWLAFDRAASEVRPFVSEWQTLEYMPAERFWAGRYAELACDPALNAPFLLAVDTALAILSVATVRASILGTVRGSEPESDSPPSLSAQEFAAMRVLYDAPPARMLTTAEVVDLMESEHGATIETSNFRSRVLPKLAAYLYRERGMLRLDPAQRARIGRWLSC